MDENDPQAYEARMERLDQANEKNFLSIRSFPIVKELGCGIAELWSNSIEKVQGESTEDEANQTRETTEELDGVFTLVTVQNQATDRRLRMRTFLRKYLLSGGKDIAAVRVRPFVNSILTLSSVTPGLPPAQSVNPKNASQNIAWKAAAPCKRLHSFFRSGAQFT